MILNALALKRRREALGDFRGRHFEASLIVEAVSWYLRYALSYRDIKEMLLERGMMKVDHSTINRWVLTYDPTIKRRLARPDASRLQRAGSPVEAPSGVPLAALHDMVERVAQQLIVHRKFLKENSN